MWCKIRMWKKIGTQIKEVWRSGTVFRGIFARCHKHFLNVKNLTQWFDFRQTYMYICICTYIYVVRNLNLKLIVYPNIWSNNHMIYYYRNAIVSADDLFSIVIMWLSASGLWMRVSLRADNGPNCGQALTKDRIEKESGTICMAVRTLNIWTTDYYWV